MKQYSPHLFIFLFLLCFQMNAQTIKQHTLGIQHLVQRLPNMLACLRTKKGCTSAQKQTVAQTLQNAQVMLMPLGPTFLVKKSAKLTPFARVKIKLAKPVIALQRKLRELDQHIGAIKIGRPTSEQKSRILSLAKKAAIAAGVIAIIVAAVGTAIKLPSRWAQGII